MSMILDALGRPLEDGPKAEQKILNVPRDGKLDYIEGNQLKSWDTNQIKDPYSANGVVKRSVNVIAANLSQLPINFYRGDQKLPVNFNDPTRVDLRTIFNDPNELDSRVRFFTKHWSYYLIYDKVFWMLNRNPVGFIKEIYPLNPAFVETIVDKNKVVSHYIYCRKIRIEVEDMIVISGFSTSSPTGDGGSSILDAVKLEYEADYYAAKFGKKFFENSTRVNGVITVDKDVPSSKEDMETVLAMWKQAHQGADNAYKVGALLSGMDYTELGQTMRDMEFIEGRKEITQRIIQTYGIPNSVYGLVEKIDRATAETQMRQFWQLTLKPMAILLQEDINKFIKNNSDKVKKYNKISMRFDFSVVEELKKDLNSTLEAADKMWRLGYPRNEVNERLQLDLPVDTEDGDTRYIPTQMMEVGAEEPAPEPIAPVLEPEPAPEPEEEEDEKKLDKLLGEFLEDEESKADTKLRSRYLRAQKQEEKRMLGKLQKYILEQRNTVLKILYGNKAEIDLTSLLKKIDAEMKKQDKKLVKLSKPLMSSASETASDLAFVALDLQKPGVVDVAIVTARVKKITGINTTIQKTLTKELTLGVKNGENVNQLAKRLKKVYGFSKTRAKTIARTETTSIMSGTTFSTYKKEGVRKKRWLIADGEARDNHQANAGMGAIGMDKAFMAGTQEMYPGESEINCRCALAPVIK